MLSHTCNTWLLIYHLRADGKLRKRQSFFNNSRVVTLGTDRTFKTVTNNTKKDKLLVIYYSRQNAKTNVLK